MDIIERKISLDGFKSHQHSFIPFIGIEYDEGGKPIFPKHGNWGEYPYDIDILKCSNFESLENYIGYFMDWDTGRTQCRVSFRDIVKKYRTLRGVLENATYYKIIVKGGERIRTVYYPNVSEKFNIEVFSQEDEIDENINIFGIYTDTTFADNGGLLMLAFILKAFGMFIVDSNYLGDNYVPEMMYYCEVQNYIDKLRIMKNGEGCCAENEYELYGGDSFLNYLGGKQMMIKNEIDYWRNSLYLINNEPLSSEMVLSFSLNAKYHNIGIYTVTDVSTGDDIPLPVVCEAKEPSKLKYLRCSKVSYCETFGENGWVDEELPVIIVDGSDGKLNMENPYKVGYPKNITTVIENGNVVSYGDMIYSITSATTESDEIRYVIGGKLSYNNTTDVWTYAEANLGDNEYFCGVRYKEIVPFHYHNYAEDNERQYLILKNGVEVNAFIDNTLMNNTNAVKIYDISENAESDLTFIIDESDEMITNKVIMEDYNFGRSETLIENVDDVIMDRGYISAFELHYKMGEVNTMNDIVNYSNNIFGL